MKIVITVNGAWNVLNFRSGLVQSFLDKGYHVIVLAPYDEAVPKLIKMGCEFHELRMKAKAISPLSGGILFWKYLKAYDMIKPDMVFSYTIKNNIFGALAARRRDITFVPNVTGLGTAFLSGRFVQGIAQALYKRAFKSVKIVFFQNADDQALFSERKLIPMTPSRVLPGSGINLCEFKDDSSQRYNPELTEFLMIARLIKDKGIFEYVAAAREVKRLHAEVKFTLIGDMGHQNRGAIRKEDLESWVAEGVIDYQGFIPDVRPYIQNADCVVLPSYREGAPRVLIEAAAMGKPLIATNVPGCRSVVDNDINGFLCAPRDSQSLRESCEKFIQLSDNAKKEMGRHSRMKMEKEFDEAIIIKAYHQVLEEII